MIPVFPQRLDLIEYGLLTGVPLLDRLEKTMESVGLQGGPSGLVNKVYFQGCVLCVMETRDITHRVSRLAW